VERYAETAAALDGSPARGHLPEFSRTDATTRPSYFRATREVDS
jgi:hypothetical protein